MSTDCRFMFKDEIYNFKYRSTLEEQKKSNKTNKTMKKTDSNNNKSKK